MAGRVCKVHKVFQATEGQLLFVVILVLEEFLAKMARLDFLV